MKTLNDENWEFVGRVGGKVGFRNVHHLDEILLLDSARYLSDGNVFIFTVDDDVLYVEHRFKRFTTENPPAALPKVNKWLNLSLAL